MDTHLQFKLGLDSFFFLSFVPMVLHFFLGQPHLLRLLTEPTDSPHVLHLLLLCREMERNGSKWSGRNILRQFPKTGPTGLRVNCAKVYRSERLDAICTDRSERSLYEPI